MLLRRGWRRSCLLYTSDAEKVINGKKMKDWLKFAMAWWHTLCAEGGDQFGGGRCV